MTPKYDLFERFSDGSSLWRACVVGLEGARLHMKDLARKSPNQFYAMHVSSGKVEFHKGGPGGLRMPVKLEKGSNAAAA